MAKMNPTMHELEVMGSLKDCCNKSNVRDVTNGYGEERHWLCDSCNCHEWKGKKYTKKEWEAWINEST